MEFCRNYSVSLGKRQGFFEVTSFIGATDGWDEVKQVFGCTAFFVNLNSLSNFIENHILSNNFLSNPISLCGNLFSQILQSDLKSAIESFFFFLLKMLKDFFTNDNSGRIESDLMKCC